MTRSVPVYAVLVLGACIMLYPFAYMLSTSLKSPSQVYMFSLVYLGKTSLSEQTNKAIIPQLLAQTIYIPLHDNTPLASAHFLLLMDWLNEL